MKRHELEHLIRSAAAITNQYDIVVVGSQSILGALPDPPEFFLRSMEADLYPLHAPELTDLIDGSIGELSPFQDQFGYYAQGVGPETAVLPKGWQDRLIKIQNENTDLKIGHCLDTHDLAASKLAAAREKDYEFVAAMIDHDFLDAETLGHRVRQLPLSDDRKDGMASWLSARFENKSGKPDSD